MSANSTCVILKGELASIVRTFDSGYLIAFIEPGGHKVVGNLPNPNIGDKLEFHGRWEHHPKFGGQFCFDMVMQVMPRTKKDMLEFLSQLKHIGPVRANNIMCEYGDDIFDILENDPQRITSISGITTKRADIIAEEWNRIKADKDTIFFLNDLGCTSRERALIMNRYKDETIEKLKSNPYRLIREIKGFGFKVVDKLALKMGVEHDSINRVKAVVEHILWSNAESNQHTYLPEKMLFNETGKFELSNNIVSAALAELESDELIERKINENLVALKYYYDLEMDISKHISRLLKYKTASDNDLKISDNFIDPVSQQTVTLNSLQLQAVTISLRNNISIITGLPGTGKTTLLKAILNIYHDKNISLASPTGKAAKRMEEATGRNACTVHRLLGYHPESGFRRDSSCPLESDLIIIDEISMMDVWLMSSLLRAIKCSTKLILVGDADQLPSVGAGNVLADLLSSEKIPSIKLTQIMRQAEKSTIIKNAHRINSGFPLDIYGKKDFFFIPVEDPDLLIRKVRKLVTQDIPEKLGLNPFGDIQVLCPQNVGSIGSVVFNKAIQRSLNPGRSGKSDIRIGKDDWSYSLREGDRVIQTVNNYDLEVYNGSTGVILEVDEQRREIVVDFNNGHSITANPPPVATTLSSGSVSDFNLDVGTWRDTAGVTRDSEIKRYDADHLIELKLAYAISIHKSQGSEFPCVVIPIHFLNRIMLQRNLIYTGITRGKSYVFIVGSENAIDYAVENDRPNNRFTRLKRFLMDKDDYIPLSLRN